MKKLKLNNAEEFTLRAILSTINEMTEHQRIDQICSDDNATGEAFKSLCDMMFDDTSMDEFMETKGFSPESSGGGCMWYIKQVRGGLTLAITDVDGMRLPETMDEPVLSGLHDGDGVEISCVEHTNLTEFFDRSRF